MKAILFFTCLLSVFTGFGQLDEVLSFSDTTGGFFTTVSADIKVSDGIIVSGSRNVNGIRKPLIIKMNVNGEVVWSTASATLPIAQSASTVGITLFDDGYVYAFSHQNGSSSSQLLWKVNAVTGEVAWIVPFTSSFRAISQIADLDATRFVVVYREGYNSNRIATYSKTTGAAITESEYSTAGENSNKAAVDTYGNVYLSFGNKLRKYNGSDFNELLWEHTYLYGPGDPSMDEIYNIYMDENNDIYLFGRDGSTFGYGNGVIIRVNHSTGAALWNEIASYGDIAMADFTDRNGYLYATYRHLLVGGGSYFWQTSKIAKSNGDLAWSSYETVTPQAGATGTDNGKSALSLDVDCNGDVYQTGYYGADNYGPANWGIMKLNGTDGEKIYDLTISEDSTAADLQSEGTVVAIFNDIPVILGNVQIGETYDTKSLYLTIDPANGAIMQRKRIGAGYTWPSYVPDIENDQNNTFVLKQEGPKLKVQRFLNQNPGWESVIPGSNIVLGKEIALSDNSVYVFGRKVLAAAEPPYYAEATDQLALYKFNRINGNLQGSQLIPVPGDARPLQLLADNNGSYLFYSKNDSICYRSWNGSSLSTEYLLDSLTQYLASAAAPHIVYNDTNRLLAATSFGLQQIDKTTLAATPFAAYSELMRASSVDGNGNTLFVAGQMETEAVAISIDMPSAIINWTVLNTDASDYTQLKADDTFLYVSATEGAGVSVKQLDPSTGEENWDYALSVSGGIVPLTLNAARSHDYIVVGGKVIQPSGSANGLAVMLGYDGELLEQTVLTDELESESAIYANAPVNDSTIWFGGSHNTILESKSGRIFSFAHMPAPVFVEMADTACLTYTWAQNGLDYTASGMYADTLEVPGSDTVVTLDLTIGQPEELSVSVVAAGAYTWPLNGQTYTVSGAYTDTTATVAGCDSIVTINLTIYSSSVNIFVLPADTTDCNGAAAITLTGTPDFTIDIGNGTPVTTDGYAFIDNLCSGIYSGIAIDGNGDTLGLNFVIPADPNYVYNNTYADSLALDSLGAMTESCTVYYNSIDSAYISGIYANADTVVVTWAIGDSSGVTTIETTYILGSGAGVYDLQLSIFCPQKSVEEVFVVTQSVYYDGQHAAVELNETPGMPHVEIFPNPTTNNVSVSLDASDVSLKILDAQGKQLEDHVFSQEKTVSLQLYADGVYFFHIFTPKGTVVKRVVKQ